ncbi:RluA family pseudouridine synthase [Periweissella beninensis]|uniref:Pseudouridine synthase n=1 Tax=Periweissella beninensis TaxID=504936 RepID=A0ABT0VGT0_9LACO|nr:RluA family pseudouridine synthase [Periweissella beninensis]MBM7544472.1 23S rRNA pseudouridine1911/1915/1917 synthase [Periweissella beninensis]MCM2437052.1 RluA family pseudouridine synthase [Periweissella beninensis]MCT4395775.1 RluA family pseudouridine synthase [Periweissella beninensis]
MPELKLVIDTQVGRIDKVLGNEFNQYTRSQLADWIKKDLVLVNGQPVKAKYAVKSGDVVIITPPKPETLDLIAENIPLDIVYEDNDLLVVNKPEGMVVHPAPGHTSKTLVNALLYHVPLAKINDTLRPGIVHRIDKDTSGLLMVAKNDIAQQKLQQELKAKKNLREYIALVHGNLVEETGTINLPLGRAKTDRKKQAVIKDGRNAVTHFTVLKRFVNYTLIKAVLETGRTHQIRVHMAYIGHPLVGDPLYGPKKTLGGHGQYLHAKTLGLTQPTTGEQLKFETALPEYFVKTLQGLQPLDDGHDLDILKL